MPDMNIMHHCKLELNFLLASSLQDDFAEDEFTGNLSTSKGEMYYSEQYLDDASKPVVFSTWCRVCSASLFKNGNDCQTFVFCNRRSPWNSKASKSTRLRFVPLSHLWLSRRTRGARANFSCLCCFVLFCVVFSSEQRQASRVGGSNWIYVGWLHVGGCNGSFPPVAVETYRVIGRRVIHFVCSYISVHWFL